MATVTELRETAYTACKAPTRYLSDPDVIDSPEEMAAVQAEWNVYFAAMRAIAEKYPYTEEEKARQPKPCGTSDD
jgi:hypothetical protein